MTTQKQQQAAKRNVRKAQTAWKSMSRRQHSLAQPEGRQRQKPATVGKGDYFHIAVRSKKDFVTFRTQDVGRTGHIQRVAGKRQSGSWDTVKWLIGKDDAHIDGEKLIPDTAAAKKVIKTLGSRPVHVKGDLFEAKPRPNIPEADKPTLAQRRAQQANIKKAQAARHRQSHKRSAH